MWLGVGHFNKSGPEMSYFYYKVGLEVTLGTSTPQNRKPQMPSADSFIYKLWTVRRFSLPGYNINKSFPACLQISEITIEHCRVFYTLAGRVNESSARLFCLNPFHPDCKTIFPRIYNNFLLYFLIFKTWTWMLCQIHILFYIKKH